MTAAFSFSRLMQLIRKQWVENARLYVFSALALLGLMGLVFLFWISTSGSYYHEDSAYIIFIVGLYISGAVFASISFNMLGDKAKGTYWLGFPASHLEKLLCMIFYTVIVFIVVYVGCFFFVKSLFVAYIERLVAENPGVYSFKKIDWTNKEGFILVFKVCVYGFFAVQAFYLMGSAYFSRFSFVITTVIGAAIMFAFGLYIAYLAEHTFPPNFSWNGDHLTDFANRRQYELSSTVKNLITYAAKYIWAPVFLVAAWFRLKEKQI
jgi:hypothetical protein